MTATVLSPEELAPLRQRTIVLVGLMGVGKSSVGRRLANFLELPFRDADNEVEAAAGRTIPAGTAQSYRRWNAVMMQPRTVGVSLDYSF